MLITAIVLGSGVQTRVVTSAHGGVVTRGQAVSWGSEHRRLRTIFKPWRSLYPHNSGGNPPAGPSQSSPVWFLATKPQEQPRDEQTLALHTRLSLCCPCQLPLTPSKEGDAPALLPMDSPAEQVCCRCPVLSSHREFHLGSHICRASFSLFREMLRANVLYILCNRL